ncbi:hypothetical protein RD792_004435 [Penstemon davidsonii]|uniref:Nodulin-like domain-containing protein n=1 Tax=Penstemon davidsonii TaxID=160366 RepID=A0ABR0DHF7_9LAMI|nr:hypothetical protein RD792_004435 [Penstemon davidsonii]
MVVAGESRKWMILVATIWIQAFTGTNLDFSSYSTNLKSVLDISQVELNYLSVASDMGKAFGWCSGVCLLYFPTWVVLFIAALMGFFGYGFQWLVIQKIIALPYFLVVVSSLLAGCSICWFNTVCYVLCIKNFPTNTQLALSLSISFNGVSAALYHLIANSIDPHDNRIYLLLNALVPLVISVIALFAIIHPLPPKAIQNHSANFLFQIALAIFTGLYLLISSSVSLNVYNARFALFGAILLLVLPLVTPGTVYVKEWAQKLTNSSLELEEWNTGLIAKDELEFIETETPSTNKILNYGNSYQARKEEDFYSNVVFKDRLLVLGEEHSTRSLIRRWDFWLYYVAYLCGGTIGLVYSNNLGQISEALGYNSEVSSLVSLYSACSFFGRLLSTTPDFLQDKMYYARTGWLALALIPTPTAFILLVLSGSKTTLTAATAMIGLSSGFVFSAAVSITSELFGPNRAGVNHNILITNIPIGSLLYSLLAALVYEANISDAVLRDGSMVCIGRNCYYETFLWWWLISLVGLVSSSLLYLRTKDAYNRSEKHKNRSETTLETFFSSYDRN